MQQFTNFDLAQKVLLSSASVRDCLHHISSGMKRNFSLSCKKRRNFESNLILSDRKKHFITTLMKKRKYLKSQRKILIAFLKFKELFIYCILQSIRYGFIACETLIFLWLTIPWSITVVYSEHWEVSSVQFSWEELSWVELNYLWKKLSQFRAHAFYFS